MAGPFYGVLGVGPDADEGEIQRAYRERVKEHHPDVSAASNAGERFKLLTTARETLTDRTERARYDRLGHDVYVETHLDSSVWEDVNATDSRASNGTEDADSSGADAHDGDADDSHDASDSEGPDAKDVESASDGEDADAYDFDGASDDEGATATDVDGASDDEGATATDVDGASDTEDSVADGRGDREATTESASPTGGRDTASGTGSSSRGSAAPTQTASSSGATTATAASDGRTAQSGSRSTGPHNAGRGGTGSSPTDGSSGVSAGSYAQSSFWNAQDPGQTQGARPDHDPLVRRVRSALAALGPWLLVHVVFLALAFGTCWYALTTLVADPASSPSLVFAMLGEAGLAVVLTAIHTMSRIYR